MPVELGTHMNLKTIEESSVTLSQVMQPQDANPAGLIHGAGFPLVIGSAFFTLMLTCWYGYSFFQFS